MRAIVPLRDTISLSRYIFTLNQFSVFYNNLKVMRAIIPLRDTISLSRYIFIAKLYYNKKRQIEQIENMS